MLKQTQLNISTKRNESLKQVAGRKSSAQL